MTCITFNQVFFERVAKKANIRNLISPYLQINICTKMMLSIAWIIMKKSETFNERFLINYPKSPIFDTWSLLIPRSIFTLSTPSFMRDSEKDYKQCLRYLNADRWTDHG